MNNKPKGKQETKSCLLLFYSLVSNQEKVKIVHVHMCVYVEGKRGNRGTAKAINSTFWISEPKKAV